MEMNHYMACSNRVVTALRTKCDRPVIEVEGEL